MLAGRSFPELIFTHFDLPTTKLSLRNVISREHARASRAQGEVEAAALMTANTLRALMIGEEEGLLLGAPTAGTHSVGGQYLLYGSDEVPQGGERTAYAMPGIFSQLAMEGSGVARGSAKDDTWAKGLRQLAEDIALRHRAVSFTAYINAKQSLQISEESFCAHCGHSLDERPDAASMRVSALHVPLSPLRQFDEKVVEISPIKLVVHPYMPEGHALLVPNELPKHYVDLMEELGWHNPRVPWSLGLYQDYTAVEEITEAGDLHLEVFTKGALRVHTPGLFGWLRRGES
jgi:hypothetical protein